MSNYKNVYFYNWFGNGDIHLSRNFVKYLSEVIPAEKFFYLHKRNPKLTLDLEPKIKTIQVNPNINEYSGVIRKNEDLYINTWVGSFDRKFYNKFGISFETNKNLYNAILDEISLEKIDVEDEELLPSIDYSKYNIDTKSTLIKEGTNVLFCNCNSISGHANNADMNGMLDRLSNQYKNFNFITTNPTPISKKNVTSVQKIFPNLQSDIIECSYISRFCKYIIGKSSGPYVTSMIKENFLDESKKFICYCNCRQYAYWYDDYKFEVEWTDNEHKFLNEFTL